eukprot:g2509.t1
MLHSGLSSREERSEKSKMKYGICSKKLGRAVDTNVDDGYRSNKVSFNDVPSNPEIGNLWTSAVTSQDRVARTSALHGGLQDRNAPRRFRKSLSPDNVARTAMLHGGLQDRRGLRGPRKALSPAKIAKTSMLHGGLQDREESRGPRKSLSPDNVARTAMLHGGLRDREYSREQKRMYASELRDQILKKQEVKRATVTICKSSKNLDKVSGRIRCEEAERHTITDAENRQVRELLEQLDVVANARLEPPHDASNNRITEKRVEPSPPRPPSSEWSASRGSNFARFREDLLEGEELLARNRRRLKQLAMAESLRAQQEAVRERRRREDNRRRKEDLVAEERVRRQREEIRRTQSRTKAFDSARNAAADGSPSSLVSPTNVVRDVTSIRSPRLRMRASIPNRPSGRERVTVKALAAELPPSRPIVEQSLASVSVFLDAPASDEAVAKMRQFHRGNASTRASASLTDRQMTDTSAISPVDDGMLEYEASRDAIVERRMHRMVQSETRKEHHRAKKVEENKIRKDVIIRNRSLRKGNMNAKVKMDLERKGKNEAMRSGKWTSNSKEFVWARSDGDVVDKPISKEASMKKAFDLKSAFNNFGSVDEGEEGAVKTVVRRRRRKKNEGRYAGQKRGNLQGGWTFEKHCNIERAKEKARRHLHPLPCNVCDDRQETRRSASLCAITEMQRYGIGSSTHLSFLKSLCVISLIVGVLGFISGQIHMSGETLRMSGMASDPVCGFVTHFSVGNSYPLPSCLDYEKKKDSTNANVSCGDESPNPNEDCSERALHRNIVLDAAIAGIVLVWSFMYEWWFDQLLMMSPPALRLGLSADQAEREPWPGLLGTRGVSRHTVRVYNLSARATTKSIWVHFDGLYDLRRSQSYAYDSENDRKRRVGICRGVALRLCCRPTPRRRPRKERVESYDGASTFRPVSRPLTRSRYLGAMYRGGWISEIVPIRQNTSQLVNYIDAARRDKNMQRLEYKLYKHKRTSDFVGQVSKKLRISRLRSAWEELRLEANRVDNIISPADVLLLDEPSSLQLRRVKNKRQLEIRSAFVTFEYEESRRRCVDDYAPYASLDRRWRRFLGFMDMFCILSKSKKQLPSDFILPDKLTMRSGVGAGDSIRVESVDIEPDDLIWENVSDSPSWIVARSLTVLVVLLAIAVANAAILPLALPSSTRSPSLHLCSDDLLKMWYLENGRQYAVRPNRTRTASMKLTRGSAYQDYLCPHESDEDDVFFLSYGSDDAGINVMNFSVTVWSDDARDFVLMWRQKYNLSSIDECESPCFRWSDSTECVQASSAAAAISNPGESESAMTCEREEIRWWKNTLPACYCERRLEEAMKVRGILLGLLDFIVDDDTDICRGNDAGYSALAPFRFLVMGALAACFGPVLDRIVFEMVGSAEPYTCRARRMEAAVFFAATCRIFHSLVSVLVICFVHPMARGPPFDAYWFRTVTPMIQAYVTINAIESIFVGVLYTTIAPWIDWLRSGHHGFIFWDGSSSQREMDRAYDPPEFHPSSRHPALLSIAFVQFFVDGYLIRQRYAKYGIVDVDGEKYGPMQSVRSLGALLPLHFAKVIPLAIAMHVGVAGMILLAPSDSRSVPHVTPIRFLPLGVLGAISLFVYICSQIVCPRLWSRSTAADPERAADGADRDQHSKVSGKDGDDLQSRDWWFRSFDDLSGKRAATKFRDERLRTIGILPTVDDLSSEKKGDGKTMAMQTLEFGDGNEWLCAVCTVTNEPNALRCDSCSAPRVKREIEPRARPMSSWEYLCANGGGHSYDIRNCQRYDAAIEMSAIRWDEVMGDLSRDKVPNSPRSVALSRPTHPASGSTLSAEQHLRLFGVPVFFRPAAKSSSSVESTGSGNTNLVISAECARNGNIKNGEAAVDTESPGNAIHPVHEKHEGSWVSSEEHEPAASSRGLCVNPSAVASLNAGDGGW